MDRKIVEPQGLVVLSRRVHGCGLQPLRLGKELEESPAAVSQGTRQLTRPQPLSTDDIHLVLHRVFPLPQAPFRA